MNFKSYLPVHPILSRISREKQGRNKDHLNLARKINKEFWPKYLHLKDFFSAFVMFCFRMCEEMRRERHVVMFFANGLRL